MNEKSASVAKILTEQPWKWKIETEEYFCCQNIDRMTMEMENISTFSLKFSGQLASSVGVPFKAGSKQTPGTVAGERERECQYLRSTVVLPSLWNWLMNEAASGK